MRQADDTTNVRMNVERSAEIMSWEESVFGSNPLEALGGMVSPSDGIHYTCESQTQPSQTTLRRCLYRGRGRRLPLRKQRIDCFGRSRLDSFALASKNLLLKALEDWEETTLVRGTRMRSDIRYTLAA